MSYREKPVLSQEEALQLHKEALVVDSQIPTITLGGLFTDNMQKRMDECFKEGILALFRNDFRCKNRTILRKNQCYAINAAIHLELAP